MKLLILATIAFVSPAAHADIQSVLNRLNSAEAQISSAQQQISLAKQELFQLLQPPRASYLCVYNYFGNQYSGRGDTEQEAIDNAVFNCGRDPNNRTPRDCAFWSNKNGNMNCRSIN